MKAVITESFERIHRSNLVGMGVLPLMFKNGETRESLGLTGEETIDILGLEEIKPRMDVTLVIHRPDGTEVTWQQIGISDLVLDPQLPYFIKWDDEATHPSSDGPSDSGLKGITLAGAPERVREWIGLSGEPGVDREEWEPSIDFSFVAPHGTPSVLSVTFTTPRGDVTI